MSIEFERLAGSDRHRDVSGEVGELLLQATCTACWEQWLGEQVKLINENKLSPAREDHYAFLVDQMRGFLKLDASA